MILQTLGGSQNTIGRYYIMNNFQKVVQLNEVFGKGSVGWEWNQLHSQMNLIDEEHKELEDALCNEDKEGVIDAVGDLLVVSYGLLHLAGINADEVMARISAANFSKLLVNQTEAEETLYKYNTLDVKTKVTGDYPKAYIVVIKDCIDTMGKFYPKGKFLKNVNWKAPKYGDLL